MALLPFGARQELTSWTVVWGAARAYCNNSYLGGGKDIGTSTTAVPLIYYSDRLLESSRRGTVRQNVLYRLYWRVELKSRNASRTLENTSLHDNGLQLHRQR